MAFFARLFYLMISIIYAKSQSGPYQSQTPTPPPAKDPGLFVPGSSNFPLSFLPPPAQLEPLQAVRNPFNNPGFAFPGQSCLGRSTSCLANSVCHRGTCDCPSGYAAASRFFCAPPPPMPNIFPAPPASFAVGTAPPRFLPIFSEPQIDASFHGSKLEPLWKLVGFVTVKDKAVVSVQPMQVPSEMFPGPVAPFMPAQPRAPLPFFALPPNHAQFNMAPLHAGASVQAASVSALAPMLPFAHGLAPSGVSMEAPPPFFPEPQQQAGPFSFGQMAPGNPVNPAGVFPIGDLLLTRTPVSGYPVFTPNVFAPAQPHINMAVENFPFQTDFNNPMNDQQPQQQAQGPPSFAGDDKIVSFATVGSQCDAAATRCVNGAFCHNGICVCRAPFSTYGPNCVLRMRSKAEESSQRETEQSQHQQQTNDKKKKRAR